MRAACGFEMILHISLLRIICAYFSFDLIWRKKNKREREASFVLFCICVVGIKRSAIHGKKGALGGLAVLCMYVKYRTS